MELLDETRARIRAEEEYRHRVFVDLNKPARSSTWDRLNSPISIWLLGSIVLGLISFWYAQHVASLKASAEARAISYGIEVRLTPVETHLSDVLSVGKMDDLSRQRISNSFTGKMEQAPDSFGDIGVPGLLFRYAAVSGNRSAAKVAREYLTLMAPLEKEGLYSRGSGQDDVTLTDSGRKLLERFEKLVAEAKDITSNATE